MNPWLHWWTDTVPLLQQPTFPRLILALLLGALIGAERQWRQRAAGMRTNTLVCFGAAAFVDLGSTLAGPNTTNIIAYVVSGVGFLGAGAIMKEGGSITGLNTAATLWCSAAVGACAGAGELLDAIFVTALLVGINLALRPLSRFIDRRSLLHSESQTIYRIDVAAAEDRQHEAKDLLLRTIAANPVLLRQLHAHHPADTSTVVFEALLESGKRDKALIEKMARALRDSSDLSAVEWSEASMEGE